MNYFRMNRIRFILTACLLAAFIPKGAALRLEPIPYGDFNNWVTRQVKESKILGGKVKTAYEIGPDKTISGFNQPYRNLGGSPWATSNVYAKVAGIVKGVDAVAPVMAGGSKAARMEAKMEHLKVMGIVNMDVIVQGTIFLGEMVEPVSSTKNPLAKMAMGMPYAKRPKALVFDYSVDMPKENTRVKASGLGSVKTLQGRDKAEVYVLLQRRWEDENGNLYAKRVGTGRERYSASVPWTKGHQLKIEYGDISSKPGYASWKGLLDGSKAYYARNSKGKLVPVHEVGWDSPDATPTHVMVMASSSCGEPFIGTPGIVLTVDNMAFGF